MICNCKSKTTQNKTDRIKSYSATVQTTLSKGVNWQLKIIHIYFVEMSSNRKARRSSVGLSNYDEIILGSDSEDYEQMFDNGAEVEADDDLNYVASSSRKRKSLVNLGEETVLKPLERTLKHRKTQQIIDKTTGTTSAQTNQKLEHQQELNRKQILSFKIDKICDYAQVLMHCLLFKINYYNKKTHFDKYIKYNMIVYVG